MNNKEAYQQYVIHNTLAKKKQPNTSSLDLRITIVLIFVLLAEVVITYVQQSSPSTVSVVLTTAAVFVFILQSIRSKH